MEFKTNTSSYNDICYVKDHILLDDIIGIMINKEMLNKPLSELPLGLNKKYLTYSTVVPKKCRHIEKCIELECGYKIDSLTLENLLEKCDYDALEKFMSLCIENAFKYKFNTSYVTLHDIISFYNHKFKLYDESGIEMNMQNVTKK